MNIALTALILIILLLPGAAILRAYYTSVKEKKSAIHIPFSELLFRGLVFSFAIHCCAVCILNAVDIHINFQLLYDLLIGKEIVFSNERFTAGFLNFCLYSLCITLFLFILTKALKKLIQSNNWDIDYYSLRNTNYWFQIFSARYLEGSGIQGERKNTDLIYLDILATGNVLYSGFLLDFNYSPVKDQLENIVLHTAKKRSFHLPESQDSKIQSGKISNIPGDVFVLPSDKIVNINIYYINIETQQ